MTEIPTAPGPPCDLCGEEPAILSLMNFADYSQIKVGAACASTFLRGVAGQIDGNTEDTVTCANCNQAIPVAEWPDHATTHRDRVYVLTCPVCGSKDEYPNAETDQYSCGHEPRSGPDGKPDLGVSKVVRSTHGNRRPRAAAARTQGEGDQE